MLATGLFALIAARGIPPAGTLLRLMCAMLCIQCAIGAANDAIDVELDRLSKPWKPIVSGAISRTGAWIVFAVAVAVAFAMALSLGWAAWLLAMLGLACGLAYDFGLKRSPYSVLTYTLALPLLPLWIWVTLGRYTPGLLWEYPLAALIGVALYLGNTAPDIVSDRAAGVRGLAHRLGLWGSLIGAWGTLSLALLLGVMLAPIAGYRVALVAAGAAGAALCLAGAIALSWPPDNSTKLARAWGLLIAASLTFGLGWLAAAP